MQTVLKQLLLAMLWLALCSGCSFEPRREHVRGTVSYDGQPIENGTIELVPSDGTTGPSLGSSITDGRFDVPPKQGPRAGGIYKVVITATRKTGQTAPNIFEPGGPPLALGEQFVPPEYNTESTLKITIDNDAAKNEHHFELRSAAATVQ